ncbi:MacB family efflux pump subunit [Caballeronia sp. LZ035]|uniref:MacB family efflux pump subunit n=1 Tax=Caballeronia sp. LZ035 TaxID=3038568 RepID=UPI002866A66F|nr:MacB family efflux pump subunit [Caballeronia sp. LZ035]MDR5755613.1 MacB family efflux pump subunit [Caballeronia sp. LZ035]
MSEPLIELINITRSYSAGDERVVILDGINLSIHPGEFVAIVGTSGSGKTSLLNIIGCLSRPSAGTYRLDGQSVLDTDSERLALLRREYFGFIFQRYNLLPQLNALENVEVPAVYAGTPSVVRRSRAGDLLIRLGLGHRTAHRPNQLSGGQQQRVSIARALMNGGAVLLADEPTGALDAKSAHEVMDIFNALNRQGHTVIMVTHDEQVAEHAHRIVKIEEGAIVDDKVTRKATAICAGRSSSENSDCTISAITAERAEPTADAPSCHVGSRRISAACLQASIGIALKSLAKNRLRSALTMLGIVIGVAAVVSIVALSMGAQKRTLDMIRSLGTNTITFWPGVDSNNTDASSKKSLTLADVDLLSMQNDVDSVSPEIEQSVLLQHDGAHARGELRGVNKDYFRVRGLSFLKGTGFSESAAEKNSQMAVISDRAQKKLFGRYGEAIGSVILINNVPARVIGIVEEKGGVFSDPNELNVWIPILAANTRIIGRQLPDRIVVRVRNGQHTDDAEARLSDVLVQRHGRKDFSTFNANSFAKVFNKTEHIMSILMIFVAITTLAVGGIGVMNMMLVSIKERTREIGIRIAVGARRNDILQQFLAEAVFLCVSGGLIGLVLSLGLSECVSYLANDWKMLQSPITAATAFASSTLVGVVFGLMPARRAARLDPIDALAHD